MFLTQTSQIFPILPTYFRSNFTNRRPLQDGSGKHPTKTLWFPKVIGKRSSRPRGGLALRVRGDLLPFDGDGGATLSLEMRWRLHYYHPPKNLHFAPDRCLRWKWTKTHVFNTNHQFEPGLIRSFSGVLIVFVSCIKILVIGQMLSNHSTPLFWCRIKTRLTSRIHKRKVYTAIYCTVPGITGH